VSRVDTFLAGQGLPSRIAYQIGRGVCVAVLRTWNRLSVVGRENIPREGPFILAPVHRSFLDTPISSCVTRRRMRFMGKDEMWKYRAGGWILSALGGFPVSRGTADREALARCIAVLRGGEPLVLFPEGERKKGPIVQPLFDGAAYVAHKAGVPIVPVGIGGSELVMPKGAWFIRPRKIWMIVGEPIPPPVGEGKSGRSAVRATTLQLHEELQRLFDLAQARAGAG
jgi:1-acyl-sn-glycerol-3-phosphate acyltransferase